MFAPAIARALQGQSSETDGPFEWAYQGNIDISELPWIKGRERAQGIWDRFMKDEEKQVLLALSSMVA
jgi:hypothetical protein